MRCERVNDLPSRPQAPSRRRKRGDDDGGGGGRGSNGGDDGSGGGGGGSSGLPSESDDDILSVTSGSSDDVSDSDECDSDAPVDRERFYHEGECEVDPDADGWADWEEETHGP